MSANDTETDERVHYRVRTPVRQPVSPGPAAPSLPDQGSGSPAVSRFDRLGWRPRTRDRMASEFRNWIAIEVDFGTPFQFVPVFLGVGALLYFSADFEPGWRPLIFGLAISVAAAWLARSTTALFPLLLVISLTIGGAIAGKWETERSATRMLGSAVTSTVTATVVAIEKRPAGRSRLTLDIMKTSRPHLKYAPDRARAVVRNLNEEIRPGSEIEGRVRLLPHSGPLYPHGYDFAFHGYFRGIGATGFFLGTPNPVRTQSGETITPQAALERSRHWLAERIRSRIGGTEGEIAVALITGFKTGIPEPVNEALRKTGLAHILSISGLHMALVAGTVIAAMRLVFALSPRFASRRPVKKYAAGLALIVVFMYLFISGSGIATQRSFLMLAVMLVAVMLDRPAITMRNLAIAATIILLLRPHEVISPGFQMSFAATAALVAAYRFWSTRRDNSGKTELSATARASGMSIAVRKLLLYAAALAATSLIAGAATAVFSVWHFHRLAPLGLVANLAAMPVTTLVVMPSAVAAVVLIPFGLDGSAFAIMGQGIRFVVSVADWTSARTPVDTVGLVPVSSILFASGGLVAASFFVSRLKLVSIPLFVLAMGLAIWRPLPDIVIGEDGKLVAFPRTDGALAVNRSRPRKFTLQGWRRALLAPGFVPPVEREAPISLSALQDDKSQTFICADDMCVAKLAGGAVIAHAKSDTAARPACSFADLIVVASATASKGLCMAGAKASPGPRNQRVITARELARSGAAAVTVSKESSGRAAGDAGTIGDYDLQLEFAISMPWRIWHEHRAFSRESRGLPPFKRQGKARGKSG